MQKIEAEKLGNRIAYLGDPMPGYHTATMMIRLEGGLVSEPEGNEGLAYVIEQALDKGTAERSARQYADAFDAIGARQAIYSGRQGWVIVLSSLPEYLPQAINLCGEMLSAPAFDDEAVQMAVNLSEQELFSLQDSPRGILRKQMVRQVYGPLLGRHMLGEKETLRTISTELVKAHWAEYCAKEGLCCVVAGKYDDAAVRQAIMEAFDPLKDQAPAQKLVPPSFAAATTHIEKELDQTQIGISFPGVAYEDREYSVEKVLLGVLSGGMSSRLFTEVREKQGLVYWVGAWHEQARNIGMVHVSAATKPDRAQATHDTLLREIARLAEDLTTEELERAKVGLIADSVTSGASVQQRANDLLVDYFHLGHATSAESKVQAVRDVTAEDIRTYLATHPRSELSVVTVGPQALEEGGGQS